MSSHIVSLLLAATLASPKPLDVLLPPEGVSISTLDNGLTVVAIADPTLPMVGVNVVVKVGSATETIATSGSSHMLEHLLFNGTEKRTQEELYADVDRFGGYNNANTSRFYTNFMMLGPSEAFEMIVEIQADMLQHSTLPADKLEKERGIVIEEIVQGRDRPGEAAERFFYEKCFDSSALGMPVLGNPSTIERLRRDDLMHFYKSYYVPNNMVMSVVGGFDVDTLAAVLDRHWVHARAHPLPKHAIGRSLPLDGPRSFVRQGKEPTTSIHLAFDAPAYGDRERLAFETGASLLESALPAELRGTAAENLRGLGLHTLAWPPSGKLVVSAELDAGEDPAPAIGALEGAIRRWANRSKEQIVPEKLARAAAMAEAEAAGLLEKPHYYGIANAEHYALADPDEVQLTLPSIARLSPEEVAEAIGPLAGRPVLAATLLGSKPSRAETGAPLEVATERLVLGNGLTLIVRTNPFAKVFAAHFLVRDRSLIEGPDREGWIDLIHRMIAGEGGDEQARRFDERLSALGGSLKAFDSPGIPYDDYYTSPRYSFLRLESPPRNAEAVLSLITERIRPLRPSTDVLRKVLEGAGAGAIDREHSARATSGRLFDEAILGASHPLNGSPELPAGTSTDRIEASALEALWAEAFVPANLVVSVVTHLPPETIADRLESTLNWRGGTPKRTWPEIPLTLSSASFSEELGKEQASLRWGAVVPIEPEDEAALKLAVSVLSSRLQSDLRETRGLAYSLGASVMVTGDRAWIEIGGGTRPENVEEFKAGMDEIVSAIASRGTTGEELESARRALLGRMRMRQLSSMSQAFQLGVGEALHASHEWSAERMRRLSEVDKSAVDLAANRYLQPAHTVEVVVY